MRNQSEGKLFDVVDVSSWRASHDEAMGSKAKVWLTAPDGRLWLFKQVRGDDQRSEDWPEKVSAELAVALGIPAARADLAERGDARGVISLDVTRGMDLVHGNELLYAQDPQYEKDVPRPRCGYTIDAVLAALAGAMPPPDWGASEGWNAADVFVGYLVFDALIANQDRHHENWGVLVDMTRGRFLSPSFDHASSLGFMLTDEDRLSRLTTKDHGRSVGYWAQRSKSHFEDRPRLVDLVREGLAKREPNVREWWLARVQELDRSVWESILARVPASKASDVTCKFAAEVLTANKRRLLDACSDLVS